jgi:peptidoglycan hydrolase-like protein with peptidoglycan-binding domain
MNFPSNMGDAERQLFFSALNNPDDSLSGPFDFLSNIKFPGKADWKTKPTLSEGATGDDVKEIQEAVGSPVDGQWGVKTTVAVKAWQKSKGLPDNGIFDADNWAVLYGKGTAEQRQAKTQKTVSDITGIASGLFASFGPKTAMATETYVPPAETEEEGGLPWGWIIGGVAVVGIVGAGYYFMTKD